MGSAITMTRRFDGGGGLPAESMAAGGGERSPAGRFFGLVRFVGMGAGIGLGEGGGFCWGFVEGEGIVGWQVGLFELFRNRFLDYFDEDKFLRGLNKSKLYKNIYMYSNGVHL